MPVDEPVRSVLKSALTDAGISDKSTCGERQLRRPLLAFLASLEGIAGDLCKPFNAFGLLCALQHFIPIQILQPRRGFEADVQILFNNAAALAFRFCSPTKEAKTRLVPLDYKRVAEADDFSWLDRYSEVIFNLYYLVDTIDLTLKKLRMLGKEASAVIDLAAGDVSGMVELQTSAELQRKVSEYDERLIRDRQTLVKQGLPIGLVKAESPLKCVVVNPNWNEFRTGNLNPAPIPVVFGMDAICTFTNLHSEQVITMFDRRAHVEDLFVFIATIMKPLVEDAENNQRFAGQGYSFVEEKQLIDYVSDWAPSIYANCFNQQAFPEGTAFVLESLGPDYWREVSPQMLRFICHDFASRDSIDSLLFRPTKFAYKCDDGTVFLHLGTVLHFFMYVWEQFTKTGQVGEIKGKAFEKLVLETLESVDGFKRIWEPGRKLDYPVSGRVGSDVDVLIRRDQLAFLISCKSYGVNREYELGNGKSCWHRSEDAKSWLGFAYRTAEVVAEHRTELKLPLEVRGVLPLVCTGWPEYLFEPSEEYFMNDGNPRIATVQEIESFFRSLDDIKAQVLLSDPWMVRISAD
jgi:hypothetical protein